MASSAPGLLERHHFALRRLHSLTGIIPVGAFLVNHMLANSTAWLGPGHFDHHVELIHSLPWLVWIETIFIFIPLAFHGIYGVVIALQGRPNTMQYPYMDNWRYTLQRVTAYILVAFVLLHLVHFRFAHWFGLAEYYGAANAKYGGVGFFNVTYEAFHSGMLGLPLWAWVVIYVIGLAAAIFHFSNGIVTFCITWGIVVGDESRKKLSVVAGAVGVVLLAWGLLSLVAFGGSRPDAGMDRAAHGGVAAIVQHAAPAGGSGPAGGERFQNQ